MLYRILLFSVKHQPESAIGIHMSLPSWSFLPSPAPSHPSRLIQRPCLSSLRHTANFLWLSILHTVSFHVTLSLHLALSSFSPCPYVCSLCLFLQCCPVNKFFGIHLSRFHIYALVYDTYLSLSDLLHSV